MRLWAMKRGRKITRKSHLSLVAAAPRYGCQPLQHKRSGKLITCFKRWQSRRMFCHHRNDQFFHEFFTNFLVRPLTNYPPCPS